MTARRKPVYERPARGRPASRVLLGALLTACLAGAGTPRAQVMDGTLRAQVMEGTLRAQSADGMLLEAREAFRRKDKDRLAALRTALPAGHALAQWVDYWELSNRLPTALPEELDAFYSRWPGTYLDALLDREADVAYRRHVAETFADILEFDAHGLKTNPSACSPEG